MLWIVLTTDMLPPAGRVIGIIVVIGGVLNGFYEAWKLSQEETTKSK